MVPFRDTIFLLLFQLQTLWKLSEFYHVTFKSYPEIVRPDMREERGIGRVENRGKIESRFPVNLLLVVLPNFSWEDRHRCRVQQGVRIFW